MVDHEGLVRKPADQFNRRIELVWFDENVVGKSMLAQALDPTQKIRSRKEIHIGFTLYDMAEPLQLGKARKRHQSVLDVRRLKIDPTHDACDKFMPLGQLKQKNGFLF